MKPSERIREIYQELKEYRNHNNDIDDLRNDIEAIAKYLDEEYEKQQTIITSDLTAKITMF